MPLPEIDTTYLIDCLTGLLNTPSPTGYTEQAIDFTRKLLSAFPDLELRTNRKGALIATWPGAPSLRSPSLSRGVIGQDSPGDARALTAHVDTLGAVVKEIKDSGRLKLSKIGGFAWNTVEGEGVTIFTHTGNTVRGSLLLANSAAHVNREVNETKRTDEAMEVRIDARTTNPAETRALGIEVGDFVAFDPRVALTNGFVRSRHLDDKACVACILAAVRALHDAGLQPARRTYLHISNYEEVGHGAAAGIPADTAELLSVDMAALGEGQNSDEYHASICIKDSGGPYHHGFTARLRDLASLHDIDYRADIYPYYGSDGEAFWNAGGDVAVALIGPGVDASHNYERTHRDALVDTTKWLVGYLLSE